MQVTGRLGGTSAVICIEVCGEHFEVENLTQMYIQLSLASGPTVTASEAWKARCTI